MKILLCLIIGLPAFADDKATFEAVCGACHSHTLASEIKSGPEWKETVETMVSLGAKATESQFAAVMRHLAKTFTRVNVNAASAAEMAPVLNIPEELAGKIVGYRKSHGDFQTIGDLKKVTEIPATAIDARKDRIAFR